jgi:hypothetical protein
MSVETVRRVTSHQADPVTLVPTEYQRAEHFVHRQIAGEHLLVALRRDAIAPIFAMTPTAAAIWERLDSWVTEATLVAHLLTEFDADRVLAERDVHEFLEQLQAANALVIREGKE